MKATELRLGNYFQSNIVQQVQIEHLEFLLNDKLDHSVMQPIPLSEEWLLKMGFTSRLETNGFYTYTNGVIEFQLHKQAYDDRLTLYDGSTDFEETKSFAPPLDYVHQLQNLYFSLCGVELEIK